MNDTKINTTVTAISHLSRWLQLHFVFVLLFVYVIAFFFHEFGEYLQSLDVGSIPWLTGNERIKIPNLLLAGVLFNAGLKIRPQHFHIVFKQPKIIIIGTLASWLIPLVYLLLLSVVLPVIRLEDRAGQIWLGLVMAAAMPVANAAAAWTQNAEGNVILCLALVLVTTLVSPLVTPITVERLSAAVLPNIPDMSSLYPARFMLLWVIWPTLLGWLVSLVIGPVLIDKWRGSIGLANSIFLALLNYVNASVALPGLKTEGDIVVISMVLALATLLCVVSYAGAIVLSRWLTTHRDEKTSIVYALGMKNVGVALILATQSETLKNFHFIGIVLISYILIQHLIGGIVQSTYLVRNHPVEVDLPAP